MADLAKLDNAIKELEEQSNDLREFNKVYSEIGKLKSDISENLRLLKENNDGFESVSTKIQERLESSKNQLDKLETELLKKIQELYQDNKNFQKELDSSITSRLEKNKSDIQVEIRNEGTQIQRSFENTLTSSLNNIKSKLKEQFKMHNNKLNIIIILQYLLISIGLALVIKVYFL